MPRLFASLLLSLVIAASASAVTMDWSFVGNAGNACDPQGRSRCFSEPPGQAFLQEARPIERRIQQLVNTTSVLFVQCRFEQRPRLIYGEAANHEFHPR
jgi:hypothetical protein